MLSSEMRGEIENVSERVSPGPTSLHKISKISLHIPGYHGSRLQGLRNETNTTEMRWSFFFLWPYAETASPISGSACHNADTLAPTSPVLFFDAHFIFLHSASS